MKQEERDHIYRRAVGAYTSELLRVSPRMTLSRAHDSVRNGSLIGKRDHGGLLARRRLIYTLAVHMSDFAPVYLDISKKHVQEAVAAARKQELKPYF